MHALVKLSGPNRKVWFLSEDGDKITHIKDNQAIYALAGDDSGGDTPVIEGVYRYKGSVDKYADLPTDGNDIGDVWNVLESHESYAAGMNYAWTGTEWDAIGGTEYTAGSGIAINNGELSVKIDNDTITADSDGVLSVSSTPGTEYTAGSGIAINNGELSVKIDNSTIIADANGVLSVNSTPGTEYTAGTGIAINDGELSVKIDGSTITATDGVLSATGGGTEYTAGTGIMIDSNNAISANIDNDTITATGGVLEARVGRDFAVNRKTAAGEEIDSGERPYGTYTDEKGDTYKTYSRIIYIPNLPNTAGIKAYPHGIENIKQIIDIYGFTTDGFVLNAPRQTVSDNITIYQTSKGSKTFSIEVGKDRSNKDAYVTVIYAKNN